MIEAVGRRAGRCESSNSDSVVGEDLSPQGHLSCNFMFQLLLAIFNVCAKCVSYEWPICFIAWLICFIEMGMLFLNSKI